MNRSIPYVVVAVVGALAGGSCRNREPCPTGAVRDGGACDCPLGTTYVLADDSCVSSESPGAADADAERENGERAQLDASEHDGGVPDGAELGAYSSSDGATRDAEVVDGAGPTVPADATPPLTSVEGPVTMISAGGAHTCALHASGAVSCWGSNGFGQLGDGTELGRPSPKLVVGLSGAVEIAAGEGATCARHSGGTVSCWGAIYSTLRNPSPTPVEGLADVVELAAGAHFACARVASGEVKCWGSNEFVLNGPGLISLRDHADTTITGVVEIAAGTNHVCVRRAPGTPVCVGNNAYGQLGYETGWDERMPGTLIEWDKLAVLTDVAEIAAGGGQSCARSATGTVVCWGIRRVDDRWGLRQADGSAELEGNDILDAVEIAIGGHSGTSNLWQSNEIDFGSLGNHGCARIASGTVRCWLDDFFGQLGDGMPAQGRELMTLESTMVVGIMDAVEITAGSGHSCARLSSGALTCWGSNGAGQLGDGTYDDRATPVPVVGLE